MNLQEINLPPRPDAEAELSRCIREVSQDPEIAEIWVYGSCARGEATADSDVDLLVVKSSNAVPESRMGLEMARKISRLKLKLPVEAVVVTKDLLFERLKKPFGIYSDLARNGRRLYARQT